MRHTTITVFFILAASSLSVTASFAKAPDAPPPPNMTTPAADPAGEVDVALLDGKMTLRLPRDFTEQSSQSTQNQSTGVKVYLYVDRTHSQVVGISEIKTANGDANDTSDAAFKKMAQGALSGLKTQFNNVKQTGQTTTTAGNRKFLRIDTEQTMKGDAMTGTTLVTPFAGRVVTLQILTPKADAKGHNALVASILGSIAFH